jgi:hypothetical protein
VAAAAEPEDLTLILAAARNGSRGQQHTLTAAAALQLHGVDPADATSAYIRARGSEPARLKYPTWWHGPIWSGSGYGSGTCYGPDHHGHDVCAAYSIKSWNVAVRLAMPAAGLLVLLLWGTGTPKQCRRRCV